MQPALVSWQNWRGCATGDLGNGTDVVQHAEGPRYHKAKLGARVLQVGVCIRVFMPVCFFACSLVLPSDPISPALVLANIEPYYRPCFHGRAWTFCEPSAFAEAVNIATTFWRVPGHVCLGAESLSQNMLPLYLHGRTMQIPKSTMQVCGLDESFLMNIGA